MDTGPPGGPGGGSDRLGHRRGDAGPRFDGRTPAGNHRGALAAVGVRNGVSSFGRSVPCSGWAWGWPGIDWPLHPASGGLPGSWGCSSGSIGIGTARLLVPVYFENREANDLIHPLLVHGGIWGRVAAVAGLAFGLGLGGWGRALRMATRGRRRRPARDGRLRVRGRPPVPHGDDRPSRLGDLGDTAHGATADRPAGRHRLGPGRARRGARAGARAAAGTRRSAARYPLPRHRPDEADHRRRRDRPVRRHARVPDIPVHSPAGGPAAVARATETCRVAPFTGTGMALPTLGRIRSDGHHPARTGTHRGPSRTPPLPDGHGPAGDRAGPLRWLSRSGRDDLQEILLE